MKPVLFPPTYRLLGYSLLVGAVGAICALLFEGIVDGAGRLMLEGIGSYHPPPGGVLYPDYELPEPATRWRLPLVTTLGGLISGFLVYRFAPEAEGHGTDASIRSYHRGGTSRLRTPIVKALASAAIIGSGGVAGREGPAAQISSGVGGLLANSFGVRGQERRILLLASMAAGLAAVFRAPLGMAIFAVEILYSGMVFESEALIYTVISAVTAYALHGLVVGWEPVFAIPPGIAFEHPVTLLGYAVLGLLAGVLGAALPRFFHLVQAFFRSLPGPPHWKPAFGGLLVGGIGMLYPQVLGTGYGWIELAMTGSLSVGTMLLMCLLKAPAMSLSIASGGSGGVFGPTVVLGGLLGGVVGTVLSGAAPQAGFVPAAFVVVGMATVFAAAARTPISTLIMTAEMTGGYALIVPTMLANVVGFVVQRSLTTKSAHPTLYEAQVETREDSPAHRGVFVRRALQMLEGGQLDPKELTLPRLVHLLQYGEALDIGHGRGLLMTIAVDEASPLAGSSVQESIGPIAGASTVAILRGDDMLVPRGPTPFAVGDQVILLLTPEAQREIERLTAGDSSTGASTPEGLPHP